MSATSQEWSGYMEGVITKKKWLVEQAQEALEDGFDPRSAHTLEEWAYRCGVLKFHLQALIDEISRTDDDLGIISAQN